MQVNRHHSDNAIMTDETRG